MTRVLDGLRIHVTCSQCMVMFEAEDWVLNLAVMLRKNPELHRHVRYVCGGCRMKKGEGAYDVVETQHE